MIFSKKQIIIFGIIIIFLISLLVAFSSRKNKQDLRTKAVEEPVNDYCKDVKISGRILSPGKFLSILSNSKSPNSHKFIYAFSNKDNLSSNSTVPVNISFSSGKDFKMTHILRESVGIDNDVLIIKYNDIDKPDLNWESKMPKRIQVNVYFEDLQGNRSVKDPECEVSFNVE